MKRQRLDDEENSTVGHDAGDKELGVAAAIAILAASNRCGSVGKSLQETTEGFLRNALEESDFDTILSLLQLEFVKQNEIAEQVLQFADHASLKKLVKQLICIEFSEYERKKELILKTFSEIVAVDPGNLISVVDNHIKHFVIAGPPKKDKQTYKAFKQDFAKIKQYSNKEPVQSTKHSLGIFSTFEDENQDNGRTLGPITS